MRGTTFKTFISEFKARYFVFYELPCARIVDGSRSSGISFKWNGSLHCLALWVRRQILYFIMTFTGKICKSMTIAVLLSI